MDPIFILIHASVPLLMLTVSAFRRDHRKRWLDFTTVLWFVSFGVYANALLYLERAFLARNFDSALLRADAAMGFHTIAFAEAMTKHAFMLAALAIVYTLEGHVVGFAWLIEQDLQLRRAVLLAGFCCFAFYLFLPAVGPGHFDWAHMAANPNAPVNCLPSMHLTWALLLAWNARSVRLRVGMWSYVALTVLSTLALREHYLVDLIAAVPYAMATQWMAARLPQVIQKRERLAARNRRAYGDAEALTPGVP